VFLEVEPNKEDKVKKRELKEGSIDFIEVVISKVEEGQHFI